MKILADESVDRQIVERLRQDGYEVSYVAEMDPGLADDEVLDIARNSKMLLLTADKDFGELVFRLKRINAGVLLLRLSGLSPDQKAEHTVDAVKEHGAHLCDAFSVVSPWSVRMRHPIGG